MLSEFRPNGSRFPWGVHSTPHQDGARVASRARVCHVPHQELLPCDDAPTRQASADVGLTAVAAVRERGRLCLHRARKHAGRMGRRFPRGYESHSADVSKMAAARVAERGCSLRSAQRVCQRDRRLSQLPGMAPHLPGSHPRESGSSPSFRLSPPPG